MAEHGAMPTVADVADVADVAAAPVAAGTDSSVGALPGTARQRVFVLGATGTIGRATVAELLRRGHEVVCFARPRPASPQPPAQPLESLESLESLQPIAGDMPLPAAASVRLGDVADPLSLARDGFRGERFDVLLSCLASRTGAPADAWAIDHRAHLHALAAARAAGVSHVVLLSAICVQKPQLAFQHAKLAFEGALIASGLDYTIVRPTAFFKSLCGQVDRVRRGRPFLLFGDGTLTACKPIADGDLATYLADCLHDPGRRNRVLPIGGPGPAITPRAQGERLFALLGREPRFRQVPLALLDAVIAVLAAAGRWLPAAAAKAELARIGRYYATESMLVLNRDSGRYDADATPSTGTDTLFDCYARIVAGGVPPERREHAVF